MRVTMHQPEHLPWLGFFHKMAQAELYVYMDVVQYRRQYFQNRNRIVGVREPIWLLVPVRKLEHRHGPIMRVPLDNSRAWRKTYWGSIAYHYHNHPHFERYADELRQIVMTPYDLLADFNYALIDFFRRGFGITTPLIKASSLDVDGKRSSLIHDVALRTGATTYLSGPTGREYLDEEPFKRSGIAVEYHEFHHPRYAQHKRDAFISHLSALDLLMNCGPESHAVLFGKPAVTSVTFAPEIVRNFTDGLKTH